jgi:hypothetical protein
MVLTEAILTVAFIYMPKISLSILSLKTAYPSLLGTARSDLERYIKTKTLHLQTVINK